MYGQYLIRFSTISGYTFFYKDSDIDTLLFKDDDLDLIESMNMEIDSQLLDRVKRASATGATGSTGKTLS